MLLIDVNIIISHVAKYIILHRSYHVDDYIDVGIL